MRRKWQVAEERMQEAEVKILQVLIERGIGKENAVRMQDLADFCHLPERRVREAIQRLRMKGIPIASNWAHEAGPTGYYLPASRSEATEAANLALKHAMGGLHLYVSLRLSARRGLVGREALLALIHDMEKRSHLERAIREAIKEALTTVDKVAEREMPAEGDEEIREIIASIRARLFGEEQEQKQKGGENGEIQT